MLLSDFISSLWSNELGAYLFYAAISFTDSFLHKIVSLTNSSLLILRGLKGWCNSLVTPEIYSTIAIAWTTAWPIFTAHKRRLGKGHVFTPVCLSTGRKGYYDVTSCYGQHSPNSTHPSSRWCPSKRSNVLLIKTVMLIVCLKRSLSLTKCSLI